jgi:hypothetical protein
LQGRLVTPVEDDYAAIIAGEIARIAAKEKQSVGAVGIVGSVTQQNRLAL